MFSIKLTALGYPFPTTLNAEVPEHFRKCIHWLEDLKIRQYPIQNRDGLRKIDSPVEWYVAYKSYKIDMAVPFLNTIADELDWFLDKAISLEYEDLELYHKFPILNINTYDNNFIECVKQLAKELKLQEYSEEEYGKQIKDVARTLKNLDKFGATTREDFKIVENQARILKLLELKRVQKTLNEKIETETLEEIKNDLSKMLDQPKVISPPVTVPKIIVPSTTAQIKCPPPPTFNSKIEKPASDADCFIVEDKVDIPPIILKTIQPEADVKLDLSPIVRNILTKLTGVQIKKLLKEASFSNRKQRQNSELAALPVKPSVLINKPVLAQNLGPKPALAQNLGSKPALAQNLGPKPVFAQKLGLKPVLAQNLGLNPVLAQNSGSKPALAQNMVPNPVVRSIQKQFPQTNGSKQQTNQQNKVTPASNGSTPIKRCSTPVKTQIVEKKQKLEDDAQVNDGTANPLKVFIYNETTAGGKITFPQSLILTQKLVQIIDEDTSKNGHLIRFDRYKLENGIFAICCASEFAIDWLKEKMNLLANLWPLAALQITQNKLKISKYTRLSAFIPGSAAESAETILKRIKRQNPLLDTDKWKVIGHYPKKNNGVQLVVGMDEESFNAIQLIEMRPFCGLARITFKEKI